jgi:tetratricopeptide (TPR) repeat protein
MNLQMAVLSSADDWADDEPPEAVLARYEATAHATLPAGAQLEGLSAVVELTLRLALRDARDVGDGRALSDAQKDVVCSALARYVAPNHGTALAGGFVFAEDQDNLGGGEEEEGEDGEGSPAAHDATVMCVLLCRCGNSIALARTLAAGLTADAASVTSSISAALRAAFPTLLLPQAGAQQPVVALLAAECKMEVVSVLSVDAMLSEEAGSAPSPSARALLRSMMRAHGRNSDAAAAAERAGDYERAAACHYRRGEQHEQEGRLAAAEEAYEACLALFERGAVPAFFAVGTTLASAMVCLMALGLVQKKQTKWDAAERSYTAALGAVGACGQDACDVRANRLLITNNLFHLFHAQRAADKCKRVLRLCEATLEAEQLQRDASFEWLRFYDAQAHYAVCFGGAHAAHQLALANEARSQDALLLLAEGGGGVDAAARVQGWTADQMACSLYYAIKERLTKAQLRLRDESSSAVAGSSARLSDISSSGRGIAALPTSDSERRDAARKLAQCEEQHAALLAELAEQGITAPHGDAVGGSLKALGDAQLAAFPDNDVIGLAPLRAAADEYPPELHGRVDYADVLLSMGIALLRRSSRGAAGGVVDDSSSREGAALLMHSFRVFRAHFSGAGAPTLVPIWTGVARGAALLGGVDVAAQLMDECAELSGRGPSSSSSTLASTLKKEAVAYARIAKQCARALKQRRAGTAAAEAPSPTACLRHLNATRTLMQQLRDAQPAPAAAAAACRGLLRRGAQAVACANPGCAEVQASGGVEFKRCSKCMFVAYCSKARRVHAHTAVVDAAQADASRCVWFLCVRRTASAHTGMESTKLRALRSRWRRAEQHEQRHAGRKQRVQ